MSLIQRVTSIEGTDREPAPAGYGSVKSLRRVISYDVFPLQEDAHAIQPTGGITAYKVSTARRFAQVVITVLSCWLASGIVFGFAALKPVLIAEKVYHESCTKEEIGQGIDECYEQGLRLNVYFAIASTTCNVSALPVGTILDRYGPRVCGIIGCVCLAAGSLLSAYAFAIPEFDGYTAGNFFLALGGTFIFLPSFQIANAFPRFSGTIVATITGAFDASAAVYLFYRLAFQSSEGTFGPDKFFFGYLIIPVLILIAQFTIMPRDSYKTVPQLKAKIEKAQDVTTDVHDSDDEIDSERELRRLRGQRQGRRESKLRELDRLVGDADERQIKAEREEDREKRSGVWGALHGRPAHEQMLTFWFILITLLTVLQMLRMNYFIATIRNQYEFMLGSKAAASQINSFFDVALPVGGVIFTPIIGFLLDSVSTASMLAFLVALLTIIGVLGSLPFVWAGYANVCLFVLLRPLYYTAMSDYAAKVFGFATFGRVYGTIICFSGLVNLSQSALDAMTHEEFHDNPIPVNAILAGAGLVIGVMLVVFVWSQGRKVRREQAQDAVTERTRLLPEESIAEEDEEDY